MPSISRSLLVAAHAIAFSALLVAPLAPVSALASPLLMPLPLPLMTANYRTVNRSIAYRKPTIVNKDAARKSTRVKHAAVAAAPVARRAPVAKISFKTLSKGRRAHDHNPHTSDTYDKLEAYYNAANTHSKNLRPSLLYVLFVLFLLIRVSESLAAQSSSVRDDASGGFHQQAASELTSFHTNLLGVETLLKELGAKDGLVNYDPTNNLETLLKNVVNINKDTLSAVTTITYNLPIVGSTLGPS
jgi:hypothetical protein